MGDNLILRAATARDAEAILEIYAPYVENTAITFEYEVPTVEEFAGRIGRVLDRYPYLVAESGGEILGYAYADAFHRRAAYDWTVETSIYIRNDRRRMGIGRRLYEALERCLKAQGVLNLIACVAYPEEEDAYLTKDSVAFHEKQGYRLAGLCHRCGYKFGRWYHVAWMEKHIGAHLKNQPRVTTFEEILMLTGKQDERV